MIQNDYFMVRLIFMTQHASVSIAVSRKKRAFLKWAGGKYALIESIAQYLPTGKC